MNTFKHFHLSLIAAALISLTSLSTHADDRISHYRGEASPTLEIAVQNLHSANAQLATLLSGELSAEDLGEIHELTYTLENALERLTIELEDIADDLEETHVGSERMAYDKVKSAGARYLQAIRVLIPEQ